MYMKKLFAMCALMIASIAVGRADSGWLLVTDSGVRIPMESVGMLVAADDATTFSVVRTAGAGDAVTGRSEHSARSRCFVGDADGL